MGIATFEAGTEVIIDDIKHILTRKVTDEIWQLEENKTKRISEFTDHELRSLYVDNKLKFISTTSLLIKNDTDQNNIPITDEDFENAKMRLAYVRPCLNIPNTKEKLKPEINEIWKKIKIPKLPPHFVTVTRWKKKYIDSGRDIISLVKQNNKKGNYTKRKPDEIIDIVNNAIINKYLTLERKTIQDTYDHIIVKVTNENKLRLKSDQLPMPGISYVKSMIKNHSTFDVYAARHGYTKARNKFRSVLGHRITDFPLDRVEIDHTPLDMIVIDDKSFLPLGRPWITACIDDFTRNIIGIFISFEPPSYLTVSRCLQHTFLPKTNLKEDYPEIENEWDAHGVMREIVVDNGLEFHSKSLENACYTLGIEIHYAPRKQGWYKGKVERVLGTLNRAVAHGHKGTTFSNIFEKEDYDPSKFASIRFSKIKEIIYKWVVDVYHQKAHRTLGTTPAVMWKSSIKLEDIQLPDDPELFDAILGKSEERVLTHKGIELNKLFYNSPEMTELRYKDGTKQKLEIRVDEADLGHIYVFSDDKKRRFKVPALRFEYANGLSAWQHKICVKYAARELKKYDSSGWLQAKEDIAILIENEYMHTKTKTRTKIARYKNDAKNKLNKKSENKPIENKPSEIIEAEIVNTLNVSEKIESENFKAKGSLETKEKVTPIFRDRSKKSINIENFNSGT